MPVTTPPGPGGSGIIYGRQTGHRTVRQQTRLLWPDVSSTKVNWQLEAHHRFVAIQLTKFRMETAQQVLDGTSDVCGKKQTAS